ncbi:hypothetical protein CDD82_1197 [Ophiocordyceps australis]|uniref:Thioesterase domain-containing protein n=1 Tax=Ophiocordyceps australis TaxID=1399860 RepID=A0A2C5YK85_9HYPO|nr:hypothetical protein CDD82_1197 [Ophiocordyceps australis]
MEVVTLMQGSPHSSLTPVFLVHAISGAALPYFQLQSLSDDDRPVYGISSPIHCANSDGFEFPATLRDLAAIYIQHILTVHAQGPFILGGWSMGGMVAMLMAQMLHDDGRLVEKVIMIDSANPELLPSIDSPEQLADIAQGTFERSVAIRGLQFDHDIKPASQPLSPLPQDVMLSCHATDTPSPFAWQNPVSWAPTPSSPCTSFHPDHPSSSPSPAPTSPDPSLASDTTSNASDTDTCNSSLGSPEGPDDEPDFLANIKLHIYHGLGLMARVQPGDLFPPGSSSDFDAILISCAAPPDLFAVDPSPYLHSRLVKGDALGWNAARFKTFTRLNFSGLHDAAFEMENIAEISQLLRLCLIDLA